MTQKLNIKLWHKWISNHTRVYGLKKHQTLSFALHWITSFIHVQVLTFGQSYQITLQLEMPESPVNQELGMFMIRTTCFSQSGQVSSSARSVSLPSCSVKKQQLHHQFLPSMTPYVHVVFLLSDQTNAVHVQHSLGEYNTDLKSHDLVSSRFELNQRTLITDIKWSESGIQMLML